MSECRFPLTLHSLNRASDLAGGWEPCVWLFSCLGSSEAWEEALRAQRRARKGSTAAARPANRGGATLETEVAGGGEGVGAGGKEASAYANLGPSDRHGSGVWQPYGKKAIPSRMIACYLDSHPHTSLGLAVAT